MEKFGIQFGFFQIKELFLNLFRIPFFRILRASVAN